MYNIELGRWESFFAKRIMTKGPDELMRICAGKSPLFNAVVKYKWRQDPFVKGALSVARRLRVLKCFDEAAYVVVKSVAFKAFQDADKGGEFAQEFMSLVENPDFNKQFSHLIDDVFVFNPKLNEVALKLFDRTEELESHGLSYNADYEKGGSKKLDLVRLNMKFQLVSCRVRFPLEVEYIKQSCQTLLSEVCHGASLCFCPEDAEVQEYYENLVLYDRYVLDEYQNALDSVDKDIGEMFEKCACALDKKYADMARYKNMIATKQLAEFQKE